MKAKILIVEDEEHIATGLRFNLEAEGYDVVCATDGEQAIEEFDRAEFDAAILDVMLPGIDGFEVARRLRERQDYTPILMLTALGQAEDVLKGFEAGADDYLPKPFDLNIFFARVNGLIRRRDWLVEKKAANTSVIVVNGRKVDLAELKVEFDGETTPITMLEAKLLRYFVDNPERAISRTEILTKVWELAEDTDTRAIDNFVVRLRRMIGDTGDKPRLLQTVRGIGYRFSPSGE
ncbi:MAG: two component transcriptional regulator, winged helix family [Acidobacteria bacterium OLB17]|nr:MAG: two component transcriptional regulator, winged helix family [Acidobacteria bacterium OLB17]MCZ2390368.1 response regulator transcription factor [Acidobacteriota bacterium]